MEERVDRYEAPTIRVRARLRARDRARARGRDRDRDRVRHTRLRLGPQGCLAQPAGPIVAYRLVRVRVRVRVRARARARATPNPKSSPSPSPSPLNSELLPMLNMIAPSEATPDIAVRSRAVRTISRAW